jgi:hypothetical protein
VLRLDEGGRGVVTSDTAVPSSPKILLFFRVVLNGPCLEVQGLVKPASPFGLFKII